MSRKLNNLKKVAIVQQHSRNNKLFGVNIHRYSILDSDFCIKLKELYKTKGYDLSTNDINSISDSSIVLYMDMPKILPKDKFKSYLFAFECPLIQPENFDLTKHNAFNKIFTWADDLIDNKKYFKSNLAHALPKKIDIKIKEKLCVLISANKFAPIPTEKDLYAKRREAIRWFEKEHIDDFDLYGVGWDECRRKFHSKIMRRLANKYIIFKIIERLYAKVKCKKYPSYKGRVEHKKPIMQKYKFSICYENSRDIPGYITEKIFDSFVAGCVPIYWGANNIFEHIPKACFIDKRDFETYEELYMFINTMSDEKYLEYFKHIETYFNSDESLQFKLEGFAQTIVKETINVIE